MVNSEKRICQNCKSNFEIDAQDFAFYEKMKVPPPTFCPECRLQKRMAWRNERTLYKRSCSLCGKQMIAIYPPDAKFPVYCRSCWFSDNWDSLKYGRNYDFSKPFFSQFKRLLNDVPRVALQVDKCVDCEYTNQIVNCKSCYLNFSANGDENCNYMYRVNFSKNVHDSFVVFQSENCYETIESDLSSSLRFSQNIGGCLNAMFCFDLAGCQDCFMTSNKRRASHVFKGEQLSREKYTNWMKEIDFGSYEKLQQYKTEFKKLKENSLNKFAGLKNVSNFSGNFVRDAKNSFHCFNGVNLENC